MIRMTTVRGSPRVAKAVQHVPEQHQKNGTVQPVATKPSVSSKGGVGVVVHLLKIKEKQINISCIEQRQPPSQYNLQREKKTQIVLLAEFCFRPTTVSFIPIY
jgi:hypothetical protein